MAFDWANNLSPLQWAVLAGIPAAIVALYFLKLRRQPLLVPSTYLWHKAVEDLHVNSLWQRLRRSLLLLLQLLLIALLFIALMNPSWQETQTAAQRNILLLDNSASMGAVDVEPNRLQEAKRRASEIVDSLAGSDTAMVISFAESAQIVQSFTNNRHQLRRAIESITLSDAGTNLDEALRMAGGLANTERGGSSAAPEVEELGARLIILSDGEVPDVDNISLGKLDAEFIPIGTAEAANVAIIAVGLDEPTARRSTRQVFARLENFGSREVTTTVSLYLAGQLLDAATVALEARKSSGVTFELADVTDGVLELRAEMPHNFDQLAIDNRAWAPINRRQRARLLLVTAGDEPLRAALSTARAAELADIQVMHPDDLKDDAYKTQSATRSFDFIIFDGCQPKEMPQSNTLFIGSLPTEGWQHGDEVSVPQILDVDVTHPMMHLIELSDVLIASARPLKPPKGSRVLVVSVSGPLMAIAPREEFEDAVIAFSIAGGKRLETNWPLRLSFPVFVLNTLEYFGPRGSALSRGIVSPGAVVTIPSDASSTKLRVRRPDGTTFDAIRNRRGALSFVASTVGVYDLIDGEHVVNRIAADLLSPAESNIAVRADAGVRIGQVKIEGQRTPETVRRETWKWLVVAALAILLVEWYIFNRRVFI